MTKRYLLLIVMFEISFHLQAQTDSCKPPITFTSDESWSSVGGVAVSNDGMYLKFIIENEPLGHKTTIIKPTTGKWERKYIDAISGDFSGDSKFFGLNKADGSSLTLDLNRNFEVEKTSSENKGSQIENEISIYESKIRRGRIIIENGRLKKIDSIDNVLAFKFYEDNDDILFTKGEEDLEYRMLLSYDINSGSISTLLNLSLDQEVLFDFTTFESNHILLKIRQHAKAEIPGAVNLDIWSYKDFGNPEPFADKNSQQEYYYAINLKENNKVIRLTGKYETLLSIAGGNALLQYRQSDSQFEFSWNKHARSAFYIVSIDSGIKKLIFEETNKGAVQAALSPDGKYVVIGDIGTMAYYSYDIATNLLKNISKNVRICHNSIDLGVKYLPFDFIWDRKHKIILDDEYDVWELDLTAKDYPVNVTRGYGRSNNISFRLLKVPSQYDEQSRELLFTKAGYILVAHNHTDKSWGFYKMANLNSSDPTKLSMGQYYYGGVEPKIIQAKKSNTYIVVRETAKESPNVYITKDFKNFKKLSDVTPEAGYNWMTTDLIRWECDNGRICDGILYKPENFDPNVKYPVVVIIYNEFSSRLNEYTPPGSFGKANYLPSSWLVSNGYIVFVPDVIYRRIGFRLKDSYNMVASGVKYISGFSFIDPNKIGIEGASWGGEQVNFFITRTDMFSAAFSGAGYSERISDFGFSDQFKITSGLMHNELNYGGSITAVYDRLIDESALLSADKVRTPLLIKHNKNDDAVPFYQGIQFFSALRRLGKKVWMLQYENGGHGVGMGKNCEDMNMRIAQFFDYYLKGKPAPQWMTGKVDQGSSNIENGLDLDSPGVTP